ncbi:response regulator receiver modulated diguanylate cyclase/phosphodiesterase [Thiorhodococcus drewsii AZ1]|uniref:Response regulator receiver modulated diguanylate cyclase/phosphodiesterase n=1 Tax=Thiorhodococcus drewsii AZ1 TaxID=765913 RepID=G2DVP3_9GAMM|nr:EAL domain-containing protein [Thiorhodococcus drewsii]EGV34058.1 response regulator receiver modulated diguanylate cyclase/phosphodiesterase [Thiorhodococcus drewsii AZ1]
MTLTQVTKDMKPPEQAQPETAILFLGIDSQLLQELKPMLEPKGLSLTDVDDPEGLAALRARISPSVLVVDLPFIGGTERLPGLISGLVSEEGACPVVLCLSRRERGDDTLERRLAALRAGADSYLPLPASSRRLADRIVRLSGVFDSRRYRILVVEPQADQAKNIAITIAGAGMDVLVVEDPMKTLDRLQAFRPNLILMSQDMPAVSGAELAAIIRDHDMFFGLPILFFSAEDNLSGQLDALRAGGDGFIPKPVRRHQLIAAIEQRVRGSRWFHDRRTLENRRESTKGFLPRDVFLRYLEVFVDSGKVARDGVGLVVLGLDQHARALERLGIGGFERLLRQMEVMIAQCMGPDEVAARLDEHRYGVLASRQQLSEIESFASELCARLSEGLGFRGGSKLTGVTVSIGVGLPTPPLEDAGTLLARAEQALKWADEAGGNQFRLWSSTGGQDEVPGGFGVIRRLVNAALNHDGLLLLHQPLVPVAKQGEEFYEAQLRLKTLDGELVTPTGFLASAERGGLMVRIDRWVLAQALEVMNQHRASHPRMRLLVHQSVETLTAPDWFPWFREQIVQRNLVQLYPVLQFQLADVRQNRLEAKSLMDRLGTYGIHACVANVMGSREDLALLPGLGVKYAKLSMQVLARGDQSELMGLIQGLQERGVIVIVAGIDDKESLERVWTCRPDFIQGSFIQLPGADLNFDFRRATAEV